MKLVKWHYSECSISSSRSHTMIKFVYDIGSKCNYRKTYFNDENYKKTTRVLIRLNLSLPLKIKSNWTASSSMSPMMRPSPVQVEFGQTKSSKNWAKIKKRFEMFSKVLDKIFLSHLFVSLHDHCSHWSFSPSPSPLPTFPRLQPSPLIPWRAFYSSP